MDSRIRSRLGRLLGKPGRDDTARVRSTIHESGGEDRQSNGLRMDSEIQFGEKRLIDGKWRVYYYGYWIRAYDAPADSLLAKKQLIHALTRRLFNHVEHGVNIPGERLGEARRAFETETCAERKRVK